MVCNLLAGEDRAGCFVLIVFWFHVPFSVLFLFLMVPWVYLQYIIVEFPGHAHLLFVFGQSFVTWLSNVICK